MPAGNHDRTPWIPQGDFRPHASECSPEQSELRIRTGALALEGEGRVPGLEGLIDEVDIYYDADTKVPDALAEIRRLRLFCLDTEPAGSSRNVGIKMDLQTGETTIFSRTAQSSRSFG